MNELFKAIKQLQNSFKTFKDILLFFFTLMTLMFSLGSSWVIFWLTYNLKPQELYGMLSDKPTLGVTGVLKDSEDEKLLPKNELKPLTSGMGM